MKSFSKILRYITKANYNQQCRLVKTWPLIVQTSYLPSFDENPLFTVHTIISTAQEVLQAGQFVMSKCTKHSHRFIIKTPKLAYIKFVLFRNAQQMNNIIRILSTTIEESLMATNMRWHWELSTTQSPVGVHASRAWQGKAQTNVFISISTVMPSSDEDSKADVQLEETTLFQARHAIGVRLVRILAARALTRRQSQKEVWLYKPLSNGYSTLV